MSAIVANGVADGTRTNSCTATYSVSSGILESISLSYGEFSLEVLCAMCIFVARCVGVSKAPTVP